MNKTIQTFSRTFLGNAGTTPSKPKKSLFKKLFRLLILAGLIFGGYNVYQWCTGGETFDFSYVASMIPQSDLISSATSSMNSMVESASETVSFGTTSEPKMEEPKAQIQQIQQPCVPTYKVNRSVSKKPTHFKKPVYKKYASKKVSKYKKYPKKKIYAKAKSKKKSFKRKPASRYARR